jgi:hypothetical protein
VQSLCHSQRDIPSAKLDPRYDLMAPHPNSIDTLAFQSLVSQIEVNQEFHRRIVVLVVYIDVNISPYILIPEETYTSTRIYIILHSLYIAITTMRDVPQ